MHEGQTAPRPVPVTSAPEGTTASTASAPETFWERAAALFRRDFMVGGISPTYYVSRWVFLRLLGIVNFIAFVSFWWQMKGLIGTNGIAPSNLFLDMVFKRIQQQVAIAPLTILPANVEAALLSMVRVPTLCWLFSGDWFLHTLCSLGVIASAVLIADIAPAICLAILFICYLSLESVTPDFLGFQWDALLLETTFLAIFFAPWKLLPGIRREEVHSRVMLMLLRWLLFRLMFMSGWVKLDDDNWRNLTALTYHFETQPLPHAFSWYAHHLPLWFSKGLVAATLCIELVVPFLLAAPRQVRAVVFFIFLIFQMSIGATGNYTFFNLLSIALCFMLIDDRHWQYITPSALARLVQRPPLKRLQMPRKLVTGALGVFLVLISGTQMCMILGLHLPYDWQYRLVVYSDAFHVANRYGLFAHMTTARNEIILEGSNDGVEWKAYDFWYKPGALDRRPPWVQPFQPRLDWQMWFAALAQSPPPWFRNFAHRLLEGKPEVLGLLRDNPFPDAPPRFIRAQLYQYRFTTPEQYDLTKQWWTRIPLGEYPQSIPRSQQIEER